MFNSTLTGNARVWFDDLPTKSIDSYNDLKKAFLENYLQQKKCIKDPIELHNIKQRDGESIKDLVRRYKLESRDVKGAPKCMRIFKFVHEITNHELIKRLHDKIPKTIDEMMRVTTSFLMKEMAALSHERKKSFPPWKQQEGEDEGIEGPMIIKAEIGGHCIHHMYVDGGSASEILYEHCFNQLRLEIKNQLMPATTPLIGFNVVRSPFPYNGIIGRPGVRKLQAVLSTAHGMLKLPVKEGVITLKSSRLVPLECAMVSGPERNLSATKKIVEERVKVAINLEYLEQTVMIDSTLSEEGHNKLCDLLQRNMDIFAWKPSDLTGVARHVAEHRLNIREGCLPARQKKRGQAADRNQVIQKEVGKLIEARIMKEVHYHNWLSNPMMVKKHDGSWRMCVDFKDLNKACLKDSYPLPEIDWKMESLCKFHFKCFLDAYKVYHQIQMAKEDKEKTTFITSQGIYCYTKMPFDLRNAKATYQRLVDKAFHKQIRSNLEVYVDDLVIKSRTKDEIVRDIEETFKTLREINMNLNPKNKSDFYWIAEAEEAFKQMKQLIAELPMLTAPMEKEELIVYLAAAKETVSAIWMTEREAKQIPIYFVIRALRGPEINYTSMEKLVLALHVLSRPKVAWRLQKWSIELGEYAIHYRPRVSVKGKILADFIVKQPEEDSPDTLMEVEEELPEPWILPKGSGKVKFPIVVIDYFIKWIEAKTVATITGNQIKKFAWESIVCRFGLPGEIISDDGKQLWDNTFKDWCGKLCIHQHFASVKHPQTNGLVERASRSLREGIKPRLDTRSKNWMEELPHVLWEHHTMIKSSNEDTLFLLTYETKAIIPAEIKMPKLRAVEVDPAQNDKALGINLNLLEEKREQAAIRKAKMEKYYNSKVRSASFKPGDLVYCNNDASRA
uniref:Reverse transcriptase domain-containing protein n=1 Tax=Tanacetum cinerariifolium TaxID=118510 RepID=A0A699GXG0_TANCI|nr:reverse transcriptase domain-containing protein [Tanacetum cinerariifolium]